MEIYKMLKFAKEMCEEHGHSLLYLCKFGSHLYGTNTPESDLDFKGLFLPNKKELLLGRYPKHLQYSSGNDESRNTEEDIDIELWSLQYFFELLGKGDTGAIDTIFSISNKSAVLYMDHVIRHIFNNPLEFFDPSTNKSFIGYMKGQVSKYGVKGSKLGVLKRIYNWLNNAFPHFRHMETIRLQDIIDDILEIFYDESYCFQKEVNGEQALVVCGKVHLFSIRLSQFFLRVEKEYQKYGIRAEMTEKNEGIDWKAVSHAIRSLHQIKSLLITGKIEYPIYSADFLLSVKKGEISWTRCEEIIKEGLDKIERYQKSTVYKGKINNKYIQKTILTLYGE
jgi:hypothetical protein